MSLRLPSWCRPRGAERLENWWRLTSLTLLAGTFRDRLKQISDIKWAMLAMLAIRMIVELSRQYIQIKYAYCIIDQIMRKPQTGDRVSGWRLHPDGGTCQGTTLFFREPRIAASAHVPPLFTCVSPKPAETGNRAAVWVESDGFPLCALPWACKFAGSLSAASHTRWLPCTHR